MDVYTVSLFGHKEFYNMLKVGKLLEKEIRELVESNEYVEFLIGRNGMFVFLLFRGTPDLYFGSFCNMKFAGRSLQAIIIQYV